VHGDRHVDELELYVVTVAMLKQPGAAAKQDRDQMDPDLVDGPAAMNSMRFGTADGLDVAVRAWDCLSALSMPSVANVYAPVSASAQDAGTEDHDVRGHAGLRRRLRRAPARRPRFAHLEHRLHRPAGTLRVGVVDQLAQPARDDLPRQPEAVLEPAARPGLAAARRQRLPQPVDLGLVVAVDDERHRLVEPELRAAVEALELLASEGESTVRTMSAGPEGVSAGERQTLSTWLSGSSVT
jgi:hypothetical protein